MGPTSDPTLRVELSAGVLILTMNRPDARNALSQNLVDALDAALTRFIADDSVGAAVITGSGSAFCAGLDLKVYAAQDADRRAVGALIHRFGQLPKPIIGAVNGPAVAGGLELALGCDWLVGSPAAVFADTHVRIGAFPGGGMTARLPRRVGAATAKAMSLGGLRLDADAALRAGLLTEVVEADRLVAHACEQAAKVVAAEHDLVRTVRELCTRSSSYSLPDALAAERAALERWRAREHSGWMV